jgi:hypothetical protein
MTTTTLSTAAFDALDRAGGVAYTLIAARDLR